MVRSPRTMLFASAVLCLAAPAVSQVYKALTVTPDHTTGLVAPTSGTVTESYQFWLVNSGQASEDVEVGFSDSSSGAGGSSTPVSNPVGPGQTAYVTVTVTGTGGQFPYWVDFWASIAGAPETGDTVRLTIDTVGSAVRPVAGRGPGLPEAWTRVFGIDGRVVRSGRVAATGAFRSTVRRGVWVTRIGDDGAGTPSVLVVAE